MAFTRGVEPLTFPFGGECSIQLNYVNITILYQFYYFLQREIWTFINLDGMILIVDNK